MIYAKSFLAGVVAVMIAALIVFTVFFGGPVLKLLTDRGGGTGFVGIRFNPLAVLVVVLVVFATGFYWEYRRIR